MILTCRKKFDIFEKKPCNLYASSYFYVHAFVYDCVYRTFVQASKAGVVGKLCVVFFFLLCKVPVPLVSCQTGGGNHLAFVFCNNAGLYSTTILGYAKHCGLERVSAKAI